MFLLFEIFRLPWRSSRLSVTSWICPDSKRQEADLIRFHHTIFSTRANNFLPIFFKIVYYLLNLHARVAHLYY